MKHAVRRIHTCIISREVLEWMRRPDSDVTVEQDPTNFNVASRSIQMMPPPDPERLIAQRVVTPLTRLPDGSMMTQLEEVTLEDVE